MTNRSGEVVSVEVLMDNAARTRCGMERLSPAENLVMRERIAQQRREWAASTPAPRPRAVPDAIVAAPAAAVAAAPTPPADPAIAAMVARVMDEIFRGTPAQSAAESAAAHRRELEEAAESAARAERAAIVDEAAALSSGPPAEDENTVVVDGMRRLIASDLELLGRVVTATDAAREVHGLAYDDADAVALEARREIARALELGLVMSNDTAVTRVTAKRAAHAADRVKILELCAAVPGCESLIVRLAADTEVDFTAALKRVQRAAHRELVVATATTLRATDAARAAADMAHAKDVARQARALIDAAAGRGELLSAAEAVAQVAALESK